MQAPIFYAPPELIAGGVVHLPDDEARHAVAVLRLRKSDPVIVIDGLGTAYRGIVAKISRRKAVELTVHAEIRNFGEPSVILTLAAGLSSGYKFDNVVARGTELGVKRFVPVLTSKSKVRLEDPRRARARVTRLEKVALAAAKQCRRAYRPEVSVPVGFAEYISAKKSVPARGPGIRFHRRGSRGGCGRRFCAGVSWLPGAADGNSRPGGGHSRNALDGRVEISRVSADNMPVWSIMV